MGYKDGIPEEFLGEDPWCIQVELGETVKMYMYFRYYLGLSPMSRNLRAVAEAFDVGYAWVGNLSSKYNWTPRAEAYDLVHMPEPDPDAWFMALSSIQTLVTSEIFQDYKTMRDKWLDMLNAANTPQDFAHVIRARENLDKMARRMGKMPLNYSEKESKPIEDKEDNEQLYLGEKGPKVLTSGE